MQIESAKPETLVHQYYNYNNRLKNKVYTGVSGMCAEYTTHTPVQTLFFTVDGSNQTLQSRAFALMNSILLGCYR